jgi:outer membrane protein OmpA-like peptidoglycan-associated protein
VKNYALTPQQRQGRRLSKNVKIILSAAAVILSVIGLMIFLGPGPTPATTELVWLAEKTVRAPGAIPDAIRTRARELGGQGGGELSVYAIGNQAHSLGKAKLDLTQDGDKVSDPARQKSAVDRQLTAVTKKLADTAVGDEGFSLYAALQAAKDEAAAGDGPVEVWLSTTVFSGSADPLTIAALTAADPTQAVDELMKGSLHELDLSAVDLHVVLLTPVGAGQQALNPRSESWRATFIKVLGERLHATVSDPLHDNTVKSAWRLSSSVPLIVPLADPPPPPPPPPTSQSSSQPPPRIDNAAFLPDTAELIEPDKARQAVSQIVQLYRKNPGRYRISIVGYCARFGEPEGARKTSSDRAMAISELLQAEGVRQSDINASGVGFDQRADPDQDPQSLAQRVVIIKLVPNS